MKRSSVVSPNLFQVREAGWEATLCLRQAAAPIEVNATHELVELLIIEIGIQPPRTRLSE